MSTVLPPAAALLLLLPLLPLLLPLLLQPAAAKAIAAKAAIAVVRLMIFLPQIEIVRPPRSALTGLVRAHGPAAAGDGRFGEVPDGGRAAISHPGEGYWPRPFDVFRRPDPSAPALTTGIAAADRSGSAAKFVQVRPS